MFIYIIFWFTKYKYACSKNFMILKLSYGDVEIELYPDKALNHVKRFKELSDSGKYDGVVYRVIDGFMAQTEMKFGNNSGFNLSLAGTGA